nr:basic proline-rich protein-like [Vulpes vulpes]
MPHPFAGIPPIPASLARVPETPPQSGLGSTSVGLANPAGHGEALKPPTPRARGPPGPAAPAPRPASDSVSPPEARPAPPGPGHEPGRAWALDSRAPGPPRPSPGPRAGLLRPGPGRLTPSPPGRPAPPLPPRPAAPGGQRGLLPALLTPVRLPPSPDLTAARPRAVSALWSRALASPLALFLSVPRECPPATFARPARNGALQGRGSSSGKVPRSSAGPPPCALRSVLPGGAGAADLRSPPRDSAGGSLGREVTPSARRRGPAALGPRNRAGSASPGLGVSQNRARSASPGLEGPGTGPGAPPRAQGSRNPAGSASPGLGGGVSGAGGHPQRAPSGPSSLRVSEPGWERFPGPGVFPEPDQERVPRTGGSRNRAGSASPGLGGVSEPGRERFPGPGVFPEPDQERAPRLEGPGTGPGAPPRAQGSRNRAGSASPGLGFSQNRARSAPPGLEGPGTGPGAPPRAFAVRSPRRDVKPSGSRLGPAARDPGTQPGAPPRASGVSESGREASPGLGGGVSAAGGRPETRALTQPCPRARPRRPQRPRVLRAALAGDPEAGRAQRAARGSRAGATRTVPSCPGEDVPLRRLCS